MSGSCRVLHVVNAGDIGGVQRLVLDLLAVQRRDPSLDVALLFLRSAAGDFGSGYAALGVPMHALGLVSGRDLSPVKYRHAVSLLRQFDVIHLHVFHVLLGLAAIRAGRPVVYTMHGVLGHGRRMALAERVADRFLRRFLRRNVALVTYNSEATQVLARHRYRVEEARGAIVYNGVALPSGVAPTAPVPSDIRLVAGRFVVGTSTRFAEFKRIDRLIDGFAIFARSHPQAVLLLVGDGVLRGALEAQVARLGIAAQVIFAGFQADVRPFQQAMSVCVFPSVAEPFGLAAVEALALGKPVIVFADGGGMLEVVKPCSPADVVAEVEALAERLAYYAEHPAEIEAGSQLRRDHARRFDIARTAAAFRDHYRAVTACAA
jgi:glycosyltransferase involved in cell wall biosynthesis